MKHTKNDNIKIALVGLAVALAFSIYAANNFVGKETGSDLSPTPQATENTLNTPKHDASSFNKKQYSLSDPSSIWIVVNKSRPLNPISYSPDDLVDVGSGQQMRRPAATALQELLSAASAKGLILQPLSGYRSYQTQVSVYDNEVATYGQAVADRESAKPGHSEHQTGLTLDVGGGGCGIEDCFGNTTEGKWLAEYAYNYGFIIRYPDGKEEITGYRYEPWHIRYVGKELAAEMKRTNTITLEEFFEL